MIVGYSGNAFPTACAPKRLVRVEIPTNISLPEVSDNSKINERDKSTRKSYVQTAGGLK